MLLLLLLLSGPSAFAAESPETIHFIGRYDFNWSGIPLAATELSIDVSKENYALRLVIASRGIVNLFTRHRSETIAHGTRHGNTYRPLLYETHYWTKDKPRHIRLVFDTTGIITQETVEPPEDHHDRPEVPHALKDGALDPLTLILAVPSGNAAPRVFDGKRLYQGNAVIMPTKKPLSVMGRDALGYVLTRRPLAGLTAKEMNAYAEGEPALAFYYINDGRDVPIYMMVPLYMGRLQGGLTKECKTWDECKVN